MHRISQSLEREVSRALLLHQLTYSEHDLVLALAECGSRSLKHKVRESTKGFACSEGARGVQYASDSFFFRGFDLDRVYADAGAFKGQMFDRPGEQRTRLLHFRGRTVCGHDQRKKFLHCA